MLSQTLLFSDKAAPCSLTADSLLLRNTDVCWSISELHKLSLLITGVGYLL